MQRKKQAENEGGLKNIWDGTVQKCANVFNVCTHSHVPEKTQSFLASALPSRSAVWRRRKGMEKEILPPPTAHTFPRETKQEMLWMWRNASKHSVME